VASNTLRFDSSNDDDDATHSCRASRASLVLPLRLERRLRKTGPQLTRCICEGRRTRLPLRR
jgi:hypothetical protein